VSATKPKAPSQRPAVGEHQIVALRERALAVMDRAYAPYSGFKVGAALLGCDGSMHDGCNVENAAYPVGLCAERGALASAIAHGSQKFEAVVIATEAEEPTPPCGMCRQMLEEFSPHMLVVSFTRAGGEARWSLDDLLPKAFTPHSLERR
jgi:cytidine deaminase